MHRKNNLFKIFLIVILISIGWCLLIISPLKKTYPSFPAFLTTEFIIFPENPVEVDIFGQLNRLQNPSNGCQNKLLIYEANLWPCGFGCSLHIIVSHLFLAQQTNRTLVVKNSHIFSYFQPIGIDCPIDSSRIKPATKGVDFTKDDIIHINSVKSHLDAQAHSKALINKAVRQGYSHKHEEPLPWLMGQFVNYIMRYNDDFQAKAKEFARKIGFKKGCVGVHVRRTDKKNEAKLYQLAEYMRHVDLYYVKHSNDTKCVYLITDEKAVLMEARTRYKEYEFIFTEDHAKFTPFYDKSIERLENILLDIYFMTECEYLVCTLSSNMGLLFYEILSSKYDSLSERLVSLDREESLKYRLT